MLPKDTQLPLFTQDSVYYLFFPNLKLNLAINEMLRYKREISRRLNIPMDQIQLDLALQWRFDKENTGLRMWEGGYYRLPSAQELEAALQQVVANDIPFHITEFEMAHVPDDEYDILFQTFSQIAIEKGARTITYGGLSHTDDNPFRSIRHALYEDGKPTATYYAYLNLLLRALDSNE